MITSRIVFVMCEDVLAWLNASGATYRFRVVAAVASGGSRQSPSSEKVYMASAVQRPKRVLLPAPVISDTRPLSSTEIFIGWQVQLNLSCPRCITQ